MRLGGSQVGRWSRKQILAIIAVSLLAIPGSAFLIHQENPEFLQSALPEVDAASRYQFAEGATFSRDLNGDKIDDWLEGATTPGSVLVVFKDSATTADIHALNSIPGTRLLHEYRYFDAAWMIVAPEAIPAIAALDFVHHIERDNVLEPTLDSASPAIEARDSRRAVLETGVQQAEYRGAWMPANGPNRGYDGTGITVALLDAGIDTTHPSLDDLDDNPLTNDPKVRHRFNAWGYAASNLTQGPDATPATFGNQGNDAMVLPHSTALAGAIAGTGDTANLDTQAQNQFDRFVYAGIAPGAALAEVVVYVGVDRDCYVEALDDLGCFPGPPITSSADTGATAGVQPTAFGTAGLSITGIEIILAHNEQNPEDPIHVAVIPLLDNSNCGQHNHGILMETAVDQLARNNVTVITSVGQNRDSICVPANSARTLSIGAFDHQGTISRDDDQPWFSTTTPGEDQDGMAKPELLAPGVEITVPRSRPADYYTVSGSSVAAAIAGGAAAVAMSASFDEDGNLTLIGMGVKSHLIQNAWHPDPAYNNEWEDEPPSETETSDGLHDEGNMTNFEAGWKFGAISLRDSVCSTIECPEVWEKVGTQVLSDPNDPWIRFARHGEDIVFGGTVVVSDPSAANFWKDNTVPSYYQNLQPVGPGVPVEFVIDRNGGEVLGAGVTGPNGNFAITATIPSDVNAGNYGCWVQTLGTVMSDTQDALQGSNNTGCFVSIFKQTVMTVDLCEGSATCNPAAPFVSYLNDPQVDFLTGSITMETTDGQPLGLVDVELYFDGARPGYERQTVTTGQNLGTADFKFPIDGTPGIYSFSADFVPGPEDAATAAFVEIPVSVGVGSQFDLELSNLVPGEILINQGLRVPVIVDGRLTTLLGDPIEGQDIPVYVQGRVGNPVPVATVTTDDMGYFVAEFDASYFQAGTYTIYAEFPGIEAPGDTGQFLILPTQSPRQPFSVVIEPVLSFSMPQSVFRGSDVDITGTLRSPFGAPFFNQTIQMEWIGSTNFVQSARTDRNGEFRFTREVPISEAVGTSSVRIFFPGSIEATPAESVRLVTVQGQSTLTMFPSQVLRGDEAILQGFLFDDTGRPMAQEKVYLTWGPDQIRETREDSFVTTDALGYYAYRQPVSSLEKVGPVTARAAFDGNTFFEASSAQASVGIVAPTAVTVEQSDEASNGVAEFTTQILDDQGHPVTNRQEMELYLAAPREQDEQTITLLDPMDLSEALAPELSIRHAYDFIDGMGVSDGARVMVSLDDGDTWSPITPRTGYTEQAIAAFGDEPGWAGTTSGWYPQSVDLREFPKEQDVRLRFRLATSALSNQIEWGIDGIKVHDVKTTVFQDDFETFGSLDNTFWSTPGTFQQGRESFTPESARVLATNLAGEYEPNLDVFASSPSFGIPSDTDVAPRDTYIFMRYRLDVGDTGDVASLALRETAGTGQRTVLAPTGEPAWANIPETEDFRWLAYKVPEFYEGRSAQIQLSFSSNGFAQGEGFQVDALRIVQKASSEVASMPDTPGHWQLTGFDHGTLLAVDEYFSTKEQGQNNPIQNPDTVSSFENGPVALTTPFPLEVYGANSNQITVYPEGIMTLGNTIGRDISAPCRTAREHDAAAVCHLKDMTLAHPVVAPAWDASVIGDDATLAVSLGGTAPERTYTLEWRNVMMPFQNTPGTRFQAIFHENGDIQFQYGNLFLNDPLHDAGAGATVGVALPYADRDHQVHANQAALRDGYGVYFSRVVADFESAGDTAIDGIVPTIGGTYGRGTLSEARFISGFDLSTSSQAYLVADQFVQLGRGDNVIVQVSPVNQQAWRPLLALQGGTSESNGIFHADREGQWSRVVYDLSPYVGNRVQIRFQVVSDAAGDNIGIAIRDLSAIRGSLDLTDAVEYSFDSYLDTDQGGDTWWSGRELLGSEANPPWEWAEHGPDAPDELGGRYLRLGDGDTALTGNSEFFLVSPPLDLSGSTSRRIDYWQKLDLVDGQDAAVIEISTDGGATYRPLRQPSQPYTAFSDRIGADAWVGPQYGFQTDTFDLTPYAADNVRIRLDFAASPTPFEARWAIDDILVHDRLLGTAYLDEDGQFLDDTWSFDASQWQAPGPLAALEHARGGLEPIAVVEGPGASTTHRVALPLETARGDLTSTLVFRGTKDHYGGALVANALTIQLATTVTEMDLRNTHDQQEYLVRGASFIVDGRVVGRDGQPINNGLVQILLDGVVVGSGFTGSDGRFTSAAMHVPEGFNLGRHELTVMHMGAPERFTLPSELSRNVNVLGQSRLIVEDQFAKGDAYTVTVRIVDDLGTPLARVGALVQVAGEDSPREIITDGTGRATFSTPVAVDDKTAVDFTILALGSDYHLGESLDQSAVVPPAPTDPFPWWWIVLAVVVIAIIVVAVLLAKGRKRRLEIQQEIAEELQRVHYQLSRGDAVRQSIFDLYRNFLHILNGAGLARPRSETPSEVARSLHALLRGDVSQSIDDITLLFEEARYSDHPLGDADRNRALMDLDRFRHGLTAPTETEVEA